MACCALLWCALFAKDARAYAWMIRHGYTSCTPCHHDPSGSGTLTSYGRALAAEALDMRFPDDENVSQEAPRTAGFLWGAFPLPEPLSLQGDLRYLYMQQKIQTLPSISSNFLMQADFAAAFSLAGFTASGSIGYAEEGALGAALTHAPEKNLVSRYYWLGYSFLNNRVMVRAGRMSLPFGLRIIEHESWVRSYTRTSINADQQVGLAASYVDDGFRTELMGIVGNPTVNPDNYRERGYSGYFEWAALASLTAGVSGLTTYRSLDATTERSTWHHVYGAFSRWASPWQPLVLMGELDYALDSPRYQKRRKGLVGILQADVEVVQGIHLIGTGELSTVGTDGPPVSWGAWLSYAWFFLPHADIRVDSVYQRIASSNSTTDALALLLQGHVFL